MSAQTVGPNRQSCLQRTSHCALVILRLIPAKAAQGKHSSAQGLGCTECSVSQPRDLSAGQEEREKGFVLPRAAHVKIPEAAVPEPEHSHRTWGTSPLPPGTRRSLPSTPPDKHSADGSASSSPSLPPTPSGTSDPRPFSCCSLEKQICLRLLHLPGSVFTA